MTLKADENLRNIVFELLEKVEEREENSRVRSIKVRVGTLIYMTSLLCDSEIPLGSISQAAECTIDQVLRCKKYFLRVLPEAVGFIAPDRRIRDVCRILKIPDDLEEECLAFGEKFRKMQDFIGRRPQTIASVAFFSAFVNHQVPIDYMDRVLSLLNVKK